FFEEKEFPEDQVPQKAIRDFETLKGKRLNKAVAEARFVTTDDVIEKDKDGLLKGMKEVKLNVSEANIFGGSISSDSYVDILSLTTGTDDESNAKIAILNALVSEVQRPLTGGLSSFGSIN